MNEFPLHTQHGKLPHGSIGSRLDASFLPTTGRESQRLASITEKPVAMGKGQTIAIAAIRSVRSLLNKKATARAASHIAWGIAAATIGIVLSPDFAFASPIEDLNTVGTVGTNVIKWAGYTGVVVGGGGACVAGMLHQGKPIVGGLAAVGVLGAIASHADRSAQPVTGAAQAANLSIFLPGMF